MEVRRGVDSECPARERLSAAAPGGGLAGGPWREGLGRQPLAGGPLCWGLGRRPLAGGAGAALGGEGEDEHRVAHEHLHGLGKFNQVL